MLLEIPRILRFTRGNDMLPDRCRYFSCFSDLLFHQGTLRLGTLEVVFDGIVLFENLYFLLAHGEIRSTIE